MILALDIGNTTVALGGIRDGRVCFVARMDTVRTRTAVNIVPKWIKYLRTAAIRSVPCALKVQCLPA